MTTILDTIIEAKRARIANAKRGIPLAELRENAERVRAMAVPHRLSESLRRSEGINVIAEFKKASPSKGAINEGADPEDIARRYERGGAAAISVLTEEDFFGGSMDDLRRVRKTISLPILRKDFIVDDYQIYEAAEAGADAILLISAMLESTDLERFYQLATISLSMDALVEVHTLDELMIATEIGATLIGVNNRNLSTFQVSLDVSRDLIGHGPKNVLMVSESGLSTREEMLELKALGYSGFLIGETLMRADNIEAELKKLTD